MEEPQTHHFYDFGIFERVPEPQHQLFLSLETPGQLRQIKKTPLEHLKHIMFINLKMLEIQKLNNFGKDGHRTIPKIHLTKS